MIKCLSHEYPNTNMKNKIKYKFYLCLSMECVCLCDASYNEKSNLSYLMMISMAINQWYANINSHFNEKNWLIDWSIQSSSGFFYCCRCFCCSIWCEIRTHTSKQTRISYVKIFLKIWLFCSKIKFMIMNSIRLLLSCGLFSTIVIDSIQSLSISSRTSMNQWASEEKFCANILQPCQCFVNAETNLLRSVFNDNWLFFFQFFFFNFFLTR